jgi:conjugal transfer pilus assembly protein TraU
LRLKGMKNPVRILITAFAFIVLLHGDASAVCKGRFLNPITDVCWNCIFPVKIAGITIIGSDIEDTPDLTSSPVCVCPAPPPLFFRIGIPISFWEPARFVETVKDPYCFPSLGISLANPKQGFLGGTHSEMSHNEVDTSTFQQAHYFIFPVWAMMELLVDFICVENSGFDLAYITEIDPLWNDDILAFIINPEVLLFANPVAQIACVADSVASNAGLPLSPLFWCMGSWGSSYPLSGHVNDDNYTQANAAIAARMVYKLSREFLICDTGVNLCGCIPTPIWVKHNYRMHIAKPVRDFACHPIGRSSLIWGYGKNPPYSAGGNAGDNFLWMLFRKRACCAF